MELFHFWDVGNAALPFMFLVGQVSGGGGSTSGKRSGGGGALATSGGGGAGAVSTVGNAVNSVRSNVQQVGSALGRPLTATTAAGRAGELAARGRFVANRAAQDTARVVRAANRAASSPQAQAAARTAGFALGRASRATINAGSAARSAIDRFGQRRRQNRTGSGRGFGN